MTPEGEVKKDVRAYLDAIGAYVFMPVPTGYGARTLDYLCCYKGRFIAIEAKARDKLPTKFQDITMTEMHKAGAIVILAWSAEDVKRALVAAGLR